MRTLQYGLFDSQAAEFDGTSWNGSRSILVYGNDTNQVAGVIDHNQNDISFGHLPGGNNLRYTAVLQIGIDGIKAILGQIPVLVNVDLTFVPYGSTTFGYLDIYRMYKGWDVGDTDNRYSDRTGLITWYEDTYAPYPGQDRASVATSRMPGATTVANTGRYSFENVTEILRLALRNNEPFRVYFDGDAGGSSSTVVWNMRPTITTRRPTLEISYLYPLEFFESLSNGDIDYSSTVQETEDGHYYLGPVERNSTGSATKGWVRNFTEADVQAELFDDHPEWIDPVQRTGTGTGDLDFVTLATNATSQLYTVVFYSSTQYEVKAEAYRDNSVSYHPTINADGTWRSDTSSSWTSPSGGLTIDSTMWQGANISSGDEFEIGVRGNTTDTSWPYDSNQQVEMCNDDGLGAPDGDWRPVLGRRERLTASVTVDATSKFFPVRHLDDAEWPVSTPIFVHNTSTINEGTITSTQERDMPAFTFTGSGLDDCTLSGNFNGNADTDLRIVIDSTGATDTFSWSRTGDATYVATGVSCATTPTLLENGLYVTFGAITGHTAADRWDSAIKTWGITVGGLTNNSNGYNVGDHICTTLPIRDLERAKYGVVNAASGASESPSSRLYLDDTSDFSDGDTVFVQQTGDSGIYESKVIAASGVEATYIDFTTSMVYDYSVGDFATVEGEGEAAFWMRPVANSTTVEELKRLRFNARLL